MPVNALHPQYTSYVDDWKRCRDAFGGRRLVKAERTHYLPWLEASESREYSDYLARSQWFDATERTTRGLAGAVLRNDTRIEVPAAMEEDLDDITLSGQDVHAFGLRVLMDQVLIGRVGVEVAMPKEESPDQRPYWNLWAAESIINWAEARIHGVNRTVLIVLKEPVLERVDDFTWDEETFRYRVLKLVPATGDELVYVQEIWIENPDKGDVNNPFILAESIAPSRRGVMMETIPFTLFNASNIEASVEKPPLMGLVDLNFGHYLNSADYENALSAIKPLYFFSGIEGETEIVLGSRRAVIAEDPAGDGKILQGADPVGIKSAMDGKRQDMGVLGGQMLEPESGPAETLGAVRIRQGGRQASLRTIATTFGVGLRKVLGHHASWIGAESADIVADPNLDFLDTTLEPDQVRAYMELLQESRISYATFYHLLRGGELTRPGVDMEEELEAIDADQESALAEAESRVQELELEQEADPALQAAPDASQGAIEDETR